MRNSLKVARWEIKRNMMNKSFLFSLILTPAIFLLFFTIPMLFQSNDTEEIITVYVDDELGIWNEAFPTIPDGFHVMMNSPEINEGEIVGQLENAEQTAYLSLNDAIFETGKVSVYLSADVDPSWVYQLYPLEEILREIQLQTLGLSQEEAAVAARGVNISPVRAAEIGLDNGDLGVEQEAENVDALNRLIPGIFAGIVLFSVVITGMMIFQSASQEKKEKVAEMILSSISPTDLMQGKILGYFVLGIVQVAVWLTIALPIVQWRLDIPLFQYLWTPELLVLLLIAIAGYLLFASIFVSMGATVEDLTATSNFQGIVMMLPWVPFILIGPIISDPSGLVAQIGSYIPITAPGVLLIRLSIMEQWPWLEVIIALAVLLLSIWLFMKLAGKIFKTGILMYGKNATMREIWKWMRH